MKLLLAFLISSSLLVAQDIPPVYKIHSVYGCNLIGECKSQQGSGILLRIRKGHGWFLSAGHVIASNPKVEIDGHKYPLTKMETWKTGSYIPDSIMLLRTTRKIPHKSLPTYHMEVGRAPKAGDKVWLIGWPYGKFQHIKTIITEVQRQQFLTRALPMNGASGGLVVYADTSTLAGVIVGFTGSRRHPRDGVHMRVDLTVERLEDQYAGILPPTRGPPEEIDLKLPILKETPSTSSSPAKGDYITEELLLSHLGALKKEQDTNLKELRDSLTEDLQDLEEDLLINQNSALQEFANEMHARKSEDYAKFIAHMNQQFSPIVIKQTERIQNLEESDAKILEAIDQISLPNSDIPTLPKPTDTPPVEGVVPQIGSGRTESTSVFEKLGAGISGLPWLTILGGLGVAVPGGAAGMAAVKVGSYLWRRSKKKNLANDNTRRPSTCSKHFTDSTVDKDYSDDDTRYPGAEHHYVVDAPSPPAKVRESTQFVNVESDNYRRAHNQARSEIARRYPGSQEILEAELSLTEQFFAGQPPE